MSRTKTLPQTLIMQMREEGRSQDDTGVFEIDLADSKVTWANDYAMERSGYTLDQVKHMTLFDIVPEVFHAGLQDAVSAASSKDATGEEKSATSVWPMKTSGGKVIWWAVTKSITEYPLVWVHGDHVQTTGPSGMSFLFMQAFMRAANGQSGLYGQMSELKTWTSAQIARLDDEDRRLKIGLSELESKMSEALEASKEAAATTRSTHSMMGDLQKAFQEFETKYGIEILKLIGTDSVHDKRIDAYEKHIKMTTDLAVKSIEMQGQKSAEGIVSQAQESSKGLSKKVIIPVSLIATIATIIQILMERFWK